MQAPHNTEQLLHQALTELYYSFAHGDNPKANKVKTDIIMHCPDVRDALKSARLALELANNLSQ
jgi:hypothetical protein